MVGYLVEIDPGLEVVAQLGRGVRRLLAREFNEVHPVAVVVGEDVTLRPGAARVFGLERRVGDLVDAEGRRRPDCLLIVGVEDGDLSDVWGEQREDPGREW